MSGFHVAEVFANTAALLSNARGIEGFKPNIFQKEMTAYGVQTKKNAPAQFKKNYFDNCFTSIISYAEKLKSR